MLTASVCGSLAAQARPGELNVKSVSFDGNHVLDDYLLASAISTTSSSWTYNLVHLGERRPFDELEFRRDVLRLLLFYRQHGYYETKVDTLLRRGSGSVNVKFKIIEGPPVLVDTIEVIGMDSVPGVSAFIKPIPLKLGHPFDRFLFEASSDSLIYTLRDHGYPYAAVYRAYDVDRRARTARVFFTVAPGPHVRIGAIEIQGNTSVSVTVVRRALTINEGDVFKLSSLFDSQRSLYQSGMFRYASVNVAPDSTVNGVDSLIRIQVRLTETAGIQMRLGAGYGTIDCFRTQGSMTKLNFLGEARRLDVVGRVSKIGVGNPLNLENSLCRELGTDPSFSNKLDYYGSVTLTQPSFLGHRNSGSITLFAERHSEFTAYRSQSIGTALTYKIGLGSRLPITLGYKVSSDQVDADPAIYCSYFNQCDQSTLAIFAQPRREANLSFTIVHTTVDMPLDPSTGHVFTLEGATAQRFLGSDIVFNRMVAEAVVYHRLGRRTVLAARLRGGILWPGASRIDTLTLSYVPPSDRFYAGGPNTVRGFARNEMGPQVYVVDSLPAFGLRSSSIGSYAIALGNVELRLPTGIWGGKVGVNLFVDVGELWDYPDSTYVPDGLRITPGFGVQIATPLGPMRLDAGYNDYGTSAGTLYSIKGTKLQPEGTFPGRARGKTLFGRLQFHFSIGLAF